MNQTRDLQITSLIPCVICSDGKLRAVALEGKQAKQIKGYIQHIQGGQIKVHTDPLHLSDEKEYFLLLADAKRITSPKARPFVSWWEHAVKRFRWNRPTQPLNSSTAQPL